MARKRRNSMPISTLIPMPDSIPVGSSWFEGLTIFTFALHILLVNILVGGTVLSLFLNRKDANGAAAQLSQKLPTVFALAVNLGVAPLLFLQVVYGQFFYTSSILSAGLWLSVIVLLIAGYAALYVNQARNQAAPGTGTPWLWFAFIVMLCIGVELSTVMSTMIRPEAWVAYVGRAKGFILNFSDPTFIPRFLHFFFASLAVGGLSVALLVHYKKSKGQKMDETDSRLGMKIFVIATCLQMATGIWWLLSLKQPVMLRFMGGNTMATIMLAAGLIFAVAALIAGVGRKPLQTAIWTGLTVLTMAVLRDIVRNASLDPWFSPENLEVTGDTSSFALFIVTLIVGLAVILYMLKLGFRKNREA